MGRVTVAIDPGDDTGWSKWQDRILVKCGLTHPDDYAELPFLIGMPFDDLVIELPLDYRKVDPNNLISLGVKVGEVIGVVRAYHHLMGLKLTVKKVETPEWKGSVPKPIHHAQHLPKLNPGEQSVLQEALKGVPKGKHHDVKDSVCLGLWRVKR